MLQHRARIAERQAHARPSSRDLEDSLSDIYYGNFSVFQSLPDVWAIDQLFPVMPIHRLGEKPDAPAPSSPTSPATATARSTSSSTRATLQKTLPLHPLREGEPYYLGVFLVGAYQETLGDLHNLMGDTNVVSVRINADGSFDFVREMRATASPTC